MRVYNVFLIRLGDFFFLIFLFPFFFPQALRIGKKLKSLDAKMYGAYWCTHCFNQKEILGKQAMSKVKYIEW